MFSRSSGVRKIDPKTPIIPHINRAKRNSWRSSRLFMDIICIITSSPPCSRIEYFCDCSFTLGHQTWQCRKTDDPQQGRRRSSLSFFSAVPGFTSFLQPPPRRHQLAAPPPPVNARKKLLSIPSRHRPSPSSSMFSGIATT